MPRTLEFFLKKCFKFLLRLFILCVLCFAYIYVYTCAMWRSAEDIGSPGIGVMGVHEPPNECRELNPGLTQD